MYGIRRLRPCGVCSQSTLKPRLRLVLRLRSQHAKVYPLFTYFPIHIQRPDMKHQNIVIIGGQSYDPDTIAVQPELMHQPRQLAILAPTP
jgi:hypothetical protein